MSAAIPARAASTLVREVVRMTGTPENQPAPESIARFPPDVAPPVEHFAARQLPDSAWLMSAVAGDHPAIQQVLSAVFQGTSRDTFHSSLDDPFYEPRDRLLIKKGYRILSHVHITQRVMHFGDLQFPVCGLQELATLPEARGRGYAGQLLKAADEAMRSEGAVLGLLSTRVPHFFRPSGWAVCGRHSHARARTRDLLAQLSVQGVPPVEGGLSIRPWRQVELPALERLYLQNTCQATGPYQRTEAYWRWLISRKAFDQIYVAIDGPDKFDLDSAVPSIVGYVIMKEDRILELMARPGYPQAGAQLLARACGEAIERDLHAVGLHAPPNDPLFDIFRHAGGEFYHHEAHQGQVFMVKLLDPPGFLRMLGGELHRRAELAKLSRPCELGLLIDGHKYRLVISRRSVKFAKQKIGRSYLSCNLAEFTRLLLGHLDLDEAIEHGRLEASTRLAVETARILFPRLPLWRPPLDELLD